MAIKAICVWNDSTAWIVSEDMIDELGQAESTRTLDVIEDEDEATEKALEVGQKRGLPVYRNDNNQPAVLLAAAPANEE